MSDAVTFTVRLGVAEIRDAPRTGIRYLTRREWTPPDGWSGTNPYRRAQRTGRKVRMARKRRRGWA